MSRAKTQPACAQDGQGAIRDADPKRRALTIAGLPPYGFINAEWMRKVPDDVPPGMHIDGVAATRESYGRWIESMVGELAEHLWPRWNRRTAKWMGRARNQAMALTRADLALMKPLALQIDQPVASRSGAAIHRHFFNEEDGFAIDQEACPPEFKRWAESYGLYDNMVNTELAQKLRQLFDVDGTRASGELSLRLKMQLQRPRPYQVAFLLGENDINSQFAHTAVTPALVSGHALQAAIAGCYTYVQCRAELTGDLLKYWSQFTVDVGDRRVFAGVHYPSDNLASWFCTSRFARCIFQDEDARAAREFLWNSVRTRSVVYQAMADTCANGRRSPYRAPLAWLLKEMS